jgi:radical SAM superfamily enzyme YgiQ (UPF0313 family)
MTSLKTDIMQIDKCDVSLICLPPNLYYYPSSGLSAVNSYLLDKSVVGKITYFSKTVNSHSLFKNHSFNNQEYKVLMPYVYLYNKLICQDSEATEKAGEIIKVLYHDVYYLDKSDSDALLEEHMDELLYLIEQEVDSVLQSDPTIIGFTSKFNQWIPAIIFASIIKKKSRTPIVIGGWTTKDAAVSILNTHIMFDYSIWGEGEVPMLQLLENVKGNKLFSGISRLAFRRGNEVNVSQQKNTKDTYVDFSCSPFLNFSDFVSLQSNESNMAVPVERSRGCNWNKCKFCCLTQGYKYKIKPNNRFIDEIKHYITKYNVFRFLIVDNDFVGGDLTNFISLLEELKKIRSTYPKFEIVMAEIITKHLSSDIIELMKECGIKTTQIGLESVYQPLLLKMSKNQTLADNLFYIKEALRYGINVSGANVIRNTLDEKDEDVIGSIHNLSFFRFFLSKPNFRLNVIDLCISNYSQYMKQVLDEGKECQYVGDAYYNTMSSRFLCDVDPFSFFEFNLNRMDNELDQALNMAISVHKKMKYTYKFIYKKGVFTYKEYSKRRLVKNISFDDEFTICLLFLLQKKIYSSLDELVIRITEVINMNDINVLKGKALKALEGLYNEGLVYYDDDFMQIVSIVNLDEDDFISYMN